MLICASCREVYEKPKNGKCPKCGAKDPKIHDFQKNDECLKTESARVIDWRKKVGLEGLVGGLECVIINTEPELQLETVRELLRYTGLKFDVAFQNKQTKTCVLKNQNSADFLITSRKQSKNPFLEYSKFPKSRSKPNTRLETFVFNTPNIEKYVSIQSEQDIEFQTKEIIHTDNYSFIQTKPSIYTANSIGFIEWKKQGKYLKDDSDLINLDFKKPEHEYLNNIGKLDHTATRVRAHHRDAAIIEFMLLTNYKFNFAIYVKIFNSITNVVRLSKKDFSMVFTSGISPYINDEESGPTEKFIHNYGTRVHHMAFNTRNIEETFRQLKADGMTFLIDLVGSRNEGLKQTFSTASPQTMLVNEYIHRYDDFDGFFTRSNATLLTGATQKQ